MTKLHVEYDHSEYGGDALSDDKWCDHEDVVVYFKPTNVHLNRANANSWRNEDIDSDEEVKSGDTVYLVVVRYSDGDTFGHSTGNYSFWGAYKNVERAKNLKELIKKDAELIKNRHASKKEMIRIQNKSEKLCNQIMELATNPYASKYNWHGYFNDLEDVEIHVMTAI